MAEMLPVDDVVLLLVVVHAPLVANVAVRVLAETREIVQVNAQGARLNVMMMMLHLVAEGMRK